MNFYRCYWKQDGELCRTDVDNVGSASEAIDAVQDSLTFFSSHMGIKLCVLAVVK